MSKSEVVWEVLREIGVGMAAAALTFAIEYLFHKLMRAIAELS